MEHATSLVAVATQAMRGSMLALALLLLSGCATPFSASVTAFHQWPADATGQSYRLSNPTGDQRDLEYAAYADMLRAAIAVTGLTESLDGSPARFKVSFQYRSETTHVIRREPVDPFYGGWGRPWGWSGYYAPAWVAVPQDAWRNVLTLSIQDAAQDDVEVYRASAISLTSDSHLLAQAMPYLLRALFDDFPGNNGQVRTVRYRQQ